MIPYHFIFDVFAKFFSVVNPNVVVIIPDYIWNEFLLILDTPCLYLVAQDTTC